MGEAIGRRIRRLVGRPGRGRWLARRGRGELEGCGGGVDADGGGLDALVTEEVVDVVHGKAGDASLEEGVALSETDLDVLCVTSGEGRLPVTVFLVAFCAGGGTGRTPGVFGVALSNTSREMPAVLSGAGLAFIFLPLHRAQASCDRRRRRGSEGPSSCPASFLRLRRAAG